MTFSYPPAPEGHFFQIKRFTDEWSGETFWTLQLRKKVWFFSRLVDAVFLEKLYRDEVVKAAGDLLERRAAQEAVRELQKDVREANKILKGKNK
jgi:hypothetical protein